MKLITGMITCALIVTMQLATIATPGFFVTAGGGYSGILSPRDIPAEIISGGFGFLNYNADENGIHIHNNKSSLGGGITASLAAGFAISENFSVEMGFQHLWSNTITANQTNFFEITSNNITRQYFRPGKINLSASMYRINPAISISTQLAGIKPFVRLGFLVGWASLDFYEEIDQIEAETGIIASNSVFRVEMSGNHAFGLSSDFGLEFTITDKISLLTELKITSMDYTPIRGKLYFAEVDGRSILSSLTTSQKEFEFVESVSYYRFEEPDNNRPTQLLKSSFPFNSIGFNLGLKYRF